MLRSLYKNIIDYILPTRCFSCASLVQGESGFCSQCWQSFNFISKPFCGCCGRSFTINLDHQAMCGNCIKSPPSYDMARSLFKFDETTKKLIHSFKYYDQTILGTKFARMLVARYGRELDGADLIIPVPMHKLKRLLRMYNQAGVLAVAIGKETGKRVEQGLLKKTKWTKPQTYLQRAQRLKNIAGSISLVDASVVDGKKVILVDDVITTGTTLNACARILKKAGAKAVIAISIAST